MALAMGLEALQVGALGVEHDVGLVVQGELLAFGDDLVLGDGHRALYVALLGGLDPAGCR